MDPYFLLRFNLHRMGGLLGDEQYDYLELLNLSHEDINEFFRECELKQQLVADELSQKYSDKISRLKDKKIMFIGDSITSDRLGYRGIVTKAGNFRCVNISCSGGTSADMYENFYMYAADAKADIISILIGTNDSLSKCGRNKNKIVSIREFERNVRGIVNDSLMLGADVIISTIPVVNEKVMANVPDSKFVINNNSDISKYNEVIRRVANESGLKLIDLENALKMCSDENLHEPDGLHLNFTGQSIMADLWLEKILERGN